MGGKNKQLLSLAGKSVIERSVSAFSDIAEVAGILVVVKENEQMLFEQALASINHCKVSIKVVPAGGETRQQSVEQGLAFVPTETEYIAIHDGARPLIQKKDILQVFEVAKKTGGAVLGTMVKDTIKVISEKGDILSTPERSTLFSAQTPQAFRFSDYQEALQIAKDRLIYFTDDAQLFEAVGKKVTAVQGSYSNIKITTPEDVKIAKELLSSIMA
ncbi:MAG: 2-C-methyl-D-erythritol 4-phosphate cytidylyltransferase, partial [Oscillospiraceae bacterium]